MNAVDPAWTMFRCKEARPFRHKRWWCCVADETCIGARADTILLSLAPPGKVLPEPQNPPCSSTSTYDELLDFGVAKTSLANQAPHSQNLGSLPSNRVCVLDPGDVLFSGVDASQA
jgi:hypothetical protein